MSLLMTGCSKEQENEIPAGKRNAVTFEMNLAPVTKTATQTNYTTTFVEGDAVGIFAYERGSSNEDVQPVVTNAKYVLGNDNTWKVDGGEGIYAENGKTFNYYAYYPYKEGITDPASIGLTVMADQSVSGAANYNASDALTAKNTTVSAGATNVPLTFKHAFSLVQVNLKGIKAEKTAQVKMMNVFPAATLNAKTEITGEANGTKGEVKMYSLPENQEVGKTEFAFRAVVPAQQLTANTVLLEITSAGKTYRFTYTANLSYEQGKVRVMNVTLGESGHTTLTIPASDTTIDLWGNSEEGTGEGKVEEVVAPAAQLITKAISALEAGSITPVTGDNQLTSSEAGWFAIVKAGTSAYEVVDDATYTKAIKATYATGQSWYSDCAVFYNPAQDLLEEKEYKLTFKAKSDLASNAQMWAYMKLKTENKFFGLAGMTKETITQEKNTTGKIFHLTTDWAEYTVTFTAAAFGDKSGPGAQPANGYAWGDISAKDYYLGLAPFKTSGVYYIADVKVEEVK